MIQNTNNKLNKSIYSEPDFLIIGAMKGGTTSLFHYLSQHSKILVPEYKEPAFFAWHNDKGYDWYLSKFPKKEDKGDKLTFEATALYLYMEDSPSRIKKYLPNVKLIAILRNPTERAYSHWNFYHESDYVNENEYRLTNLKDTRSFEKAVQAELNGKVRSDAHTYLKNGYYYEQVKRYCSLFDKENLLILDFSELKNDISSLMSKICSFLEIENEFGSVNYNNENKKYVAVAEDNNNDNKNIGFARFNTNKSKKKMSASLFNELSNHFKEKNKGLNELVDINFEWNK